MKETNNYKCPACGGGIKFNPQTGKVVCEYCDSSYTIEEIEKIYGVQQESTSTSAHSSSQQTSQTAGFDSQEGTWDTDGLNSNWGSEAQNMREYNCPSCGAAIICDASTAATSCPYCDNPTVIETQFSSLRPDYVIPFKLMKNDAISALKEFYKNKKVLPKEFSSENHLEEIKGIYVPFWFFDGTAEGFANFDTTTVSRRFMGNKEIVTTRHFECRRAGTLEFSKIPVDASKKMPDDLMDSLEPFDYSELKEFSTAYLPGFLADKEDVSIEESIERANTRCARTFINEIVSSVTGYSSVSLKERNIAFKTGTVHYGLLPVYLLYTKWNDNRYLFAVNGQTGKIVGNLPASGKRSFMYFMKNMLISFGISTAIVYFALKFFLGM